MNSIKKNSLVLFFLVALTVFSTAVQADVKGEGKIGLASGLEFINLYLLLATIGLLTWQIFKYTKGTVSIIWGYFLVAVLLLASIQLFLVLVDKELIMVHDSTFHISWHLLFYLSMVFFVLGGKGLVDLAGNKSQDTQSKLFVWTGIAVVFTIAIFAGAEAVDGFITANFEGTFLDTFGIHHFGAFVAALLAAFYMFKIRNMYEGMIGVIATPLLLFLALFGVFHLWELVTESWKLIAVEVSVIEGVEQIIALPALAILLYGFYMSKQMMEKFAKTIKKS